MHSIEVCASSNMAKQGAPGSSPTTTTASDSDAGAEFGEALADMGTYLTKKYPAVSVIVGVISTLAYIMFALDHWTLHPVILVLTSLAVFGFATFYLIALLIVVGIAGLAFLVFGYLVSLL